MAAPTLVAEDWTFDPLEPEGADQLYGRMHAAEPRRVRRTELEGHVEVRALAERRVGEDDAGRAEDAVAALSEIAVRAGNAHALRHQGGLAALGLRRRPAERRARDPRSEQREDRPPPEVDAGWEPEPLTDAGQPGIARRLVTARVECWSAVSLAPLLAEGATAWASRRRGPP